MKKIIVVTGGAGFVGSNLIKYLIKKTNFLILSIDNYSAGSKRNHINSNKVKYIKADTKNIEKNYQNIKEEFIPFFILENFQEFIKASSK